MVLTEFFHQQHFQWKYKFHYPPKEAAMFIDCFWETDFGSTQGVNDFIFTDQILPFVGTTILFNMGSPFILARGQNKFYIDKDQDILYSRLTPVTSTHFSGNSIFAIRMQSNIFLENMASDPSWTEQVYPADKIFEAAIIQKIKSEESFEKRCEVVLEYFLKKINKNQKAIHVASNIHEAILSFNGLLNENMTVYSVAREVNCTTKTLERYFEKYIGGTPKKCFRILRFRKAIEHYTLNPDSFSVLDFGYFDRSHFYREVKEFTGYNLGYHKNSMSEDSLYPVKAAI